MVNPYCRVFIINPQLFGLLIPIAKSNSAPVRVNLFNLIDCKLMAGSFSVGISPEVDTGILTVPRTGRSKDNPVFKE